MSEIESESVHCDAEESFNAQQKKGEHCDAIISIEDEVWKKLIRVLNSKRISKAIPERIQLSESIAPSLHMKEYDTFRAQYEEFTQHMRAKKVGVSTLALDGCATCDDEDESFEPLNIFGRHMQKRMLGFARAMVYLGQDFLATFAVKTNGIMSEKKKRQVAQINDAIAPWARLIIEIASDKNLAKLSQYVATEIDTTRPLTYVRFNLENTSTYVGRSEFWHDRVKRHFMCTINHDQTLNNGCKGCREHMRYMRHNPIPAARWITIPLINCIDKQESVRVETLLIKRMKPSINQGDKPFWMLRKDRYVTQTVHRPRESRKVPWKNIRHANLELRYLTEYEHEGKKFKDLQELLIANKNTATQGITVIAYPGCKDMGSSLSRLNVLAWPPACTMAALASASTPPSCSRPPLTLPRCDASCSRVSPPRTCAWITAAASLLLVESRRPTQLSGCARGSTASISFGSGSSSRIVEAPLPLRATLHDATERKSAFGRDSQACGVSHWFVRVVVAASGRRHGSVCAAIGLSLVGRRVGNSLALD